MRLIPIRIRTAGAVVAGWLALWPLIGPESGGEGDGRGSRGASYRTLSRSTVTHTIGPVQSAMRDIWTRRLAIDQPDMNRPPIGPVTIRRPQGTQRMRISTLSYALSVAIMWFALRHPRH